MGEVKIVTFVYKLRFINFLKKYSRFRFKYDNMKSTDNT